MPFGLRLVACVDEHERTQEDFRRTAEEPKVIPDYLIIDEIRRRQEDAWEPEPLRLPLYVPQWPPRPEEDEQSDEPASRVIIIDMVGD